MANSSLPPDVDPQETAEWREAIEVVAEREGINRALRAVAESCPDEVPSVLHNQLPSQEER